MPLLKRKDVFTIEPHIPIRRNKPIQHNLDTQFDTCEKYKIETI